MKNTIFMLNFILGLLLCDNSQLNAAHIIGGDMTYENIGVGEYQITMTLYRDCQSGGANFDSEPMALLGRITVYNGQQIYAPYGSLPLLPPVVSAIENSTCDQNLCIEKGIYTFTISLPISQNVYSIVYQRCCRNAGLTNVFMPDIVGTTIYVQISPLAQHVGNSGPKFAADPLFEACLNTNYVLDHSCTNSDTVATSLRYLLCTPKIGGGPIGALGGTGHEQPDGVAPNPDLPPPYEELAFTAPHYTYFNPLGETSTFTLDSVSGQLSLNGSTSGTYAYGVCVKEYLNDEVIAESRRDYVLYLSNHVNVTEHNNYEIGDIWYDSKDVSFQVIKNYDGEELKLVVFGINSLRMNEYSIKENRTVIDASSYSSGMYILLLLDQKGRSSQRKIIIF